MRCFDHGAAAIVVSNHGGRQLDRAPVPLELVEPTVQTLGGRAEVLIDTGITHGADILAGVALGARAALVGRAYLYGLMAGGRDGVDRTITILKDEIARTMKLLGVSTLEELNPGHVTQLVRLAPRALPAGTAEAVAAARPKRPASEQKETARPKVTPSVG